MKRFIVIIGLLVSLGVMAGEKRDHYYAVKDGYTYGYEVADSNELFLVEYLGQKDGHYQVLTKNGEDRAIFQCKKGCEYITVFEYWKTKFRNKSMLKADSKKLGYQIMSDAWNGKLEQFRRDDDGATLWVDGKNGRVWSTDSH